MTNSAAVPASAPASFIQGVTVPHDLYNALTLYFEANANVSEQCAELLTKLTNLRVAQLPAPSQPPTPQSKAKLKLDGLRRRKETAQWRWGELQMHGAPKETVAEAYRHIQEAEAEIKTLLQEINTLEQTATGDSR